MLKNTLKLMVLATCVLVSNSFVYANSSDIDPTKVGGEYYEDEQMWLFDGDFKNGELINGKIVYEEQSDGYIEFVVPKEKIDSNGNFTFEILSTVTSTSFGVSDDRIVVSSKAKIINPAGKDVTSDYPDHRYAIDLIGGDGTRTFYADGVTLNKVQFYVTPGNTYKIRIRNVDYLPAGTNVVGSGSITNYVHP